MPKFYEIRTFTVFGYISLIVFTYIGFAGGKNLLFGFLFIPIPLICELIITIKYINYSIENRKVHFLCFSVLLFIMATFAGIRFDVYETTNTSKYLIDIGNTIDEYKTNNGLRFLTDNDISKIGLPEDITFESSGNNFILKLRDATYLSETKEVYFRSRP